MVGPVNCIARESMSIALAAPWTKVLQPIHWLFMYSLKVHMTVLFQWEGMNGIHWYSVMHEGGKNTPPSPVMIKASAQCM